MQIMTANSEYKKSFGDTLKQIRSKFNRCFWPLERCSETAIRAHSIQNSKVLDLLCEENHVIMPEMCLNIDTGPYLKFTRIGRNNATTFTGLCDKHDSQLFAPIDKSPLSCDSQEQLFLLAYRSVLKELHAKMKAAIDLQNQFENSVAIGRVDPNIPSEPMLIATTAIAASYTFYRYKFHYDQIYTQRDFYQIEHQIAYVKNIHPTIAVSSVYTYDDMYISDNEDIPKCIALNIFPDDGGLHIIFSFIRNQGIHIRPYIGHILQAETYLKQYLISKLILMYCENFVMSPKFYKTLTTSRIETIKKFFEKNLYGEKNDCDDTGLYLFY
jgi:hypothetical protein